MAKVIIPGVPAVPNREFDANEGDLALFAYDPQIKAGEINSLTLGVFQGFRERAMKISSPFILEGCEQLGGINICIVRTPIYRAIESDFIINAHLRVLEFGQERVADYLKKLNGFEAHAEWVSRLTKPYLR